MRGLEEPYKTRPIRYLGVWELIGWRMKAYSIAYGKDTVRGELVDAARRVALERISRAGESVNHYGVGFIGIHEGKNGNFVFVDWWADGNELHHHVYTSPLDQPDELTYMTPTGLAACAWDLRIGRCSSTSRRPPGRTPTPRRR